MDRARCCAFRDWEAKLTPTLAESLRRRRKGKVSSSWYFWYIDETYIWARGRWRYLYRAIDRDGALVDVMLSEHRDLAAARTFVRSAKAKTAIVLAALATAWVLARWSKFIELNGAKTDRTGATIDAHRRLVEADNAWTAKPDQDRCDPLYRRAKPCLDCKLCSRQPVDAMKRGLPRPGYSARALAQKGRPTGGRTLEGGEFGGGNGRPQQLDQLPTRACYPRVWWRFVLPFCGRRSGDPFDREAEGQGLLLNPAPSFVWRGAHLRGRTAPRRAAADERCQELLVRPSLDPGEKLAPQWHGLIRE
jgi:hypothetical protein